MCSDEYDNIWNKDYISVIKSKRRSIGIEVHMDGRVILRAPYTLSEKQLEEFVDNISCGLKKSDVILEVKPKQEYQPMQRKKMNLLKMRLSALKKHLKNVLYITAVLWE